MTTENSDRRTTAEAQRRLLEALAALENTSPGGIPGLRLGIPTAVELMEAAGQVPLANVWRSFDDLAASVYDDLKEPTHG